ncbi:MAG: transpeptidase family protein [Bacteroidales bacterium]|nr:transpeptidase family protein [Bacteroidales bacterium]
MEETKTKKKSDRVVRSLYLLYLGYILGAVLVVVRIIQLQLTYQPDERIADLFHPRSIKQQLDPERGSILAHDGRLIAMSTPMYQVYMDCAVLKREYRDMKDKAKGQRLEAEWRKKADTLAIGLHDIYGDRTAAEYRKLILDGREANRRYVRIGHQIDHGTLQKVKALCLFREGQNTGGMMTEKIDTRQYPYESLARRTVGYVKDNSRTGAEGITNVGIEGRFDYVLHGKEGFKWMKHTDGRELIQNYDSAYVAPVDGFDVRTTLDIDIQDIADRSLRARIEEFDPSGKAVEGGCVIVMDVATGAIRAMVNLLRDPQTGRLGETINFAVERAGEPGSVFKASTLMSLLEDGKVRLSTNVPTNHGIFRVGRTSFPQDSYITTHEAQTHLDSITVLRGFEISSNYVFRRLAIENYGSRPQTMLDKLYSYKLGEAWDFDLDRFPAPTLPRPDSRGNVSLSDLGSVAIGYSVTETPLHVAAFYNAIANRGRMMKPYLVESIESHGAVKEKRGPSVLGGLICSRETADSLAFALRHVVMNGTARAAVGGAKMPVAGKTGTARIVLEPEERMGSRNPYEDALGHRKYQATFVGFYPADAPKYTTIVVAYTRVGGGLLYGSGIPAKTFRDIVDHIYAIDMDYGEVLDNKAPMPSMSLPEREAPAEGIVPDVKGLGVMDAVYEIENRGWKCVWHGTGHVRSQSPAAGVKLAKGNTVTLELK